MRDVAAFASSDEGRLYATTCERWGIDPGAILDDDVLAYNLRLALVMADRPEPEPKEQVLRLASRG
jgi:hypothetical protein